MKKKHTRNVRIDRPERTGLGRHLERLMLRNKYFNLLTSASGKAVLSCLIWPRYVAPFRWKLTRQPLPLFNLHPVFNGYKILQLTDLHVGKTKLTYLAQVFTRCLEEKPDLIVITGDLIDYRKSALAKLRRLLEPLVRAGVPDGIVAIFGNHDYHEYSWRHVGPRSAKRAIHKRLVRMLGEFGIRLLRNEQFRVQRALPSSNGDAGRGGGKAEFVVVGIDEMWTGRADATAAFEGLSRDEPILCLQHNPDGIDFLRPFPWQYMMCGHTHGGQARLPLIGVFYVPMEHREYLHGCFQFPPLEGQNFRQRTMFVSRGLGYSTPIRMRCSPEATLFTLEAAQ